MDAKLRNLYPEWATANDAYEAAEARYDATGLEEESLSLDDTDAIERIEALRIAKNEALEHLIAVGRKSTAGRQRTQGVYFFDVADA